MGGIPSLRNRAVLVRGTVRVWSRFSLHCCCDRLRCQSSHTNFVWAVVLLIRFADLAFEAGLDLSAYADTIADLDGGHFWPHLDSLSDDFMPDAEWQRTIAPPSIDGVDIASADAASFDLDVDVTIFEWLWLEL